MLSHCFTARSSFLYVCPVRTQITFPASACQNGVENFRVIGAEELRKMEPHIHPDATVSGGPLSAGCSLMQWLSEDYPLLPLITDHPYVVVVYLFDRLHCGRPMRALSSHMSSPSPYARTLPTCVLRPCREAGTSCDGVLEAV